MSTVLFCVPVYRIFQPLMIRRMRDLRRSKDFSVRQISSVSSLACFMNGIRVELDRSFDAFHSHSVVKSQHEVYDYLSRLVEL
ncbi:hypothetical protein Plhal304r1_c064g0151051 [Plasmopara halstedii]